VFVSQHKKKRAKGFALRRLSALDAHWIVQFKFVDGDLTALERFKLRLLNKDEPIFTGPVFSAPQAGNEIRNRKVIQRNMLIRRF